MKKLYIKQKVFSLSEKFTITDENEQPFYHVEGSFMKIPKTFTILDEQGNTVSLITKKTFSMLPKFFVEVDGEEMIEIAKQLTFVKSKYTISAKDIDVQGNWWDMDFSVTKQGKEVAQIHKRWFSWGDTYEVTIYEDDLERLILSLVVAIDRVKEDDDSAASATAVTATI